MSLLAGAAFVALLVAAGWWPSRVLLPWLGGRGLYRAERPKRSPVIGTDSPIQYEAPDADPSTV